MEGCLSVVPWRLWARLIPPWRLLLERHHDGLHSESGSAGSARDGGTDSLLCLSRREHDFFRIVSRLAPRRGLVATVLPPRSRVGAGHRRRPLLSPATPRGAAHGPSSAASVRHPVYVGDRRYDVIRRRDDTVGRLTSLSGFHGKRASSLQFVSSMSRHAAPRRVSRDTTRHLRRPRALSSAADRVDVVYSSSCGPPRTGSSGARFT